MLSRIIFSVLLVFQTATSFSNPLQEHLNQFFDTIVQQGRDTLPGLAPQPKSAQESALEAFSAQNFLLWDYLTNTTNNNLPQHFDDLTALCQRRNIKRAIIFIKDPSANSFFGPTNTSANSFISKANTLFSTMSKQVSGFELSIFFESGGFSSTAGAGSYPTVNPKPDTGLTDYFSQIDEMLDWSKAIIAQVPGIKEVAFDPQFKSATKDVQQLLYNYADEYKWLNSLGDTRLGTTLGIDESKPTYANLSTFPVSSILAGSISTFPANPQPTWSRGGNPKAPLLQSVYIQAYQTSIPAMFASGFIPHLGTHNGGNAGRIFNQMLRDLPYVTGTGRISFMQHSTKLNGNSDTVFKTFADPILFAKDSVNNIHNRKIGVVSSVQENDLLTLDSVGATFTETNSKFTRTEITTAWNTQPNLTQSMVDNIYWMFSLNYDPSQSLNFFGNWQLSDFMAFITASLKLNTTAKSSPFTNLVFPSKNYVIYNYNFATTTVDTTPTSNGNVQSWGL
ncbi:MAG: hypothetical protein S4CHLAM37_10130 [Chlamydiia bacterium]|nr:hypothetical protein [Chlamydiia bacterium]